MPDIPLESAAYEGQMRVGRVLFDSRNGLGNVYNNTNVAYKGFVVWMKPQDFLRLNPPRSAEQAASAMAATRQAIEEGQGIGPPFLDVELVTEGADAGSFRVRNHEGRGRMMAINEIAPDTPVPVQMFGRGAIDRGRDITPEMLEGLVDPESPVRILADRRVASGGEVKPDAAWHVPLSEDYRPNDLPTGRVYRSPNLRVPDTPRQGAAQQELFSPGEIGGAQGPVNPQERGSTMVSRSDDLPPPPPVGERSPPGSLTAARNAAAARATEEANRARMLRNAGIRSGLETLGTAAEAGMLGYNTIQEGDPIRGAMRTGAETIEGVGSILRAPEAAVEMTGAPLPPWENPLRHLSETGDAITRVASPYRRWQEREARIRENTPDRVTQQREARSEAVRRALAPKE